MPKSKKNFKELAKKYKLSVQGIQIKRCRLKKELEQLKEQKK